MEFNNRSMQIKEDYISYIQEKVCEEETKQIKYNSLYEFRVI